MNPAGQNDSPVDEDDLTRWDATIFDRCLRAGLNPFGSGPTPIFRRDNKPAVQQGTNHPEKGCKHARS